MPIFQNGQQRLSYDDSGGDGPVVVFNHSFGMNGAMFLPQQAALQDRFRCIIWDQRGHGGSFTDRAFTFWDSAQDCVALLDHLEVEKASLVGISQGGFVSLRAALLAPDRVRSLAVLGTSAGAETENKKALYQQMGGTFSNADGPPQEVLDAFADICFASFDTGPWKDIWRLWPSAQVALALQTLLDRDDVTDRLKEVQAPIVVLHGTADNAFAVSHGQAIADRVPRSDGCVIVEGGSHFLSMTNPEPVNAVLSAFLSRHA